MTKNATLSYDGKSFELPVVVGTEDETAVDISNLRTQSGLITLDNGYANTGACSSRITFIDGEKGILRYRGYPVEELAERSSFVETAYLLIFGELPTAAQLAEFRRLLGRHEYIHEDMLHHFDGFPANAPPMAILSAMINAVGCFQPVFMQPEDSDHFMEPAARLMSKVRTIAAASYRKSIGRPVNYPRTELRYTANLLHMMFSQPHKLYQPDEVVVRALTASCCCTRTTSRTARRRPSGWWALRRQTSMRQWPRASARCGVRCTAARMWRSWTC